MQNKHYTPGHAYLLDIINVTLVRFLCCHSVKWVRPLTLNLTSMPVVTGPTVYPDSCSYLLPIEETGQHFLSHHREELQPYSK